VQTLLNLGSAPSPERPTAAVERWARPISFTLTVPAEMTEAGILSGGPAAKVTRDMALSVPACKRGRDLICGTLGTLRLKQHDSTRRVTSSQLLEQPEPDVARSVTMTRTVEDMLFDEKAWWRITAFDGSGYPAQVRKLAVCDVAVQPDGRVFVKGVHVPDAELIRIDSPNPGLLTAGATAIRAAHALARASSRYTNNPLPLGYFTPEGDVDPGDDEDIEDILDDFEDSMARRTWAYVGAGLKANPLQWSPEQLQLSGQRDYAVLEIARVMGVDPEELGVSTTSRTYANAEQRRLDLIDFTLAAYVVAIEDRLSMPDVTPPGYYVRAEYGQFLRSDTQSRMATYEVGRRVGVYDDERIAELEDIPTARVRAAAAAAKPAPPQGPQQAAPAARQPQEAAR
jgi:hypothetical protein